MSEELPPLSSELKALFEAEREAGPMPAAARAQVWQGLASQLPKPLPKRVWYKHAVARHVLTAVVSLGIGTGAGIAIQAHRDRIVFQPPPVLAAVPAPSQFPAPSLRSLTPQSPTPPVPQSPSSSAARVGGAPSSSPLRPTTPVHPAKRQRSRDDILENPFQRAAPPAPAPAAAPEGTLQREQALLDTARTALSRGDARGALGLLFRHDREYPRGELAEESEALRIQALLATNVLEAREAAAAFKASYPHSLLLPAIQQSLESSP